jgi:hypothetical protein
MLFSILDDDSESLFNALMEIDHVLSRAPKGSTVLSLNPKELDVW